MQLAGKETRQCDFLSYDTDRNVCSVFFGIEEIKLKRADCAWVYRNFPPHCHRVINIQNITRFLEGISEFTLHTSSEEYYYSFYGEETVSLLSHIDCPMERFLGRLDKKQVIDFISSNGKFSNISYYKSLEDNTDNFDKLLKLYDRKFALRSEESVVNVKGRRSIDIIYR